MSSTTKLGCKTCSAGGHMPAVMVITLGNAMGVSERATASLAEKVADGRPWNVTIAKPGIQTRIGLVSERFGRVTDSLLVSTPKWWPTADGLCLKPSALFPEHCVTLIVRPNGYDAIENGELHLELRR
jgi:hypothetical protein